MKNKLKTNFVVSNFRSFRMKFRSFGLRRGFTLIELLVVIAIIGILSSVVLVSLQSTRTKAKDSSAQISMSNIMTAAELYYSDNSNYTNVCSDLEVAKLMLAVKNQVPPNVPPTCTSKEQSYTVSVELNNLKTFCVDSNGFSGTLPPDSLVTESGVKCQ